MVTTGIFYYGYDEARAIAIQTDGKTVTAGVASTCYEVCALISFALDTIVSTTNTLARHQHGKICDRSENEFEPEL